MDYTAASKPEPGSTAAHGNPNTGHGHVFPRPDGVKARCGGPAICAECALDAQRKRIAEKAPEPNNPEPTPSEADKALALAVFYDPERRAKAFAAWRADLLAHIAAKTSPPEASPVPPHEPTQSVDAVGPPAGEKSLKAGDVVFDKDRDAWYRLDHRPSKGEKFGLMYDARAKLVFPGEHPSEGYNPRTNDVWVVVGIDPPAKAETLIRKGGPFGDIELGKKGGPYPYKPQPETTGGSLQAPLAETQAEGERDEGAWAWGSFYSAAYTPIWEVAKKTRNGHELLSAIKPAFDAIRKIDRERNAAEIKALRGWKKGQLEVESTWDVRAVGDEIKAPLGSRIRPLILPALIERRERAEKAETRVREIEQDLAAVDKAIEKLNDGEVGDRVEFIEWLGKAEARAEDLEMQVGSLDGKRQDLERQLADADRSNKALDKIIGKDSAEIKRLKEELAAARRGGFPAKATDLSGPLDELLGEIGQEIQFEGARYFIVSPESVEKATKALDAALAAAPRPETPTPDFIRVVFDGPPSHESGRFIEVETLDGKGINFGEWEHDEKYWYLKIPVGRKPTPATAEEVERRIDAWYLHMRNKITPSWLNSQESVDHPGEVKSTLMKMVFSDLAPSPTAQGLTEEEEAAAAYMDRNWGGKITTTVTSALRRLARANVAPNEGEITAIKRFLDNGLGQEIEFEGARVWTAIPEEVELLEKAMAHRPPSPAQANAEARVTEMLEWMKSLNGRAPECNLFYRWSPGSDYVHVDCAGKIIFSGQSSTDFIAAIKASKSASDAGRGEGK